METRAFREAQQVVTQGMPVIDGIVTDESDSMDTVATEESDGAAETTEVATGASEDEDRDAESEPSANPHRRTRQRKSFTMDGDVYNLLGTLAKTNGTNRSAFIEQLILRAGDLSLAPQIQELLGVMATRAGMTRTEYLEMLILKADAIVTWHFPAETEALVEALGQTGVGRTGRTFGELDSGGGSTPAVTPRRPPVR